MAQSDKEEIRQAVREAYGKVAKIGAVTSGINPSESCCSPGDILAETNQASPCGCIGADFSLEQMAAVIGYSKDDIDSVPEGANMGLGCGNPVTLASLKSGETVVDLGSGGGFDCFLAARQVGETGHVIGVDMTPDMLSKARKNAEKIGASNVEFRLGEIEHLPVADNSADVIMSNCVINLSPDKLRVFQDVYRVLKPGGRLVVSDIVATAVLPDEIQKNLSLVTACIGGAATIDDTRKMLKKAGFEDIRIKPNQNSRELIRQWDPGKSSNAGDYIVSAGIEAVKPS